MRRSVFTNRVRRKITWILLAVLSQVGVCAHATACAAALDAEARRGVGRPLPEQATALARVAFDALEPAYPIVREPRAWSDPNATWLDARGWLPETWNPHSLDQDAWAEMLAKMQTPYHLTAEPIDRAPTPASLLGDVKVALQAGAGAVRPLVFVAPSTDDARHVRQVIVTWNWTPYPRALVVRLRPGTYLDEGRVTEDLLEQVGTCAWTAEAWIAIPRERLLDVLVGRGVDVGVELLATDRGAGPAIRLEGRPEDALDLDHPDVDADRVASFAFLGSGPQLSSVLGVLLTARSNLTLLDVPHYAALP